VSSFNKLNNKNCKKIILNLLILRGKRELERQIPNLEPPQDLTSRRGMSPPERKCPYS
jgi:hypothetical protein